MICGISIGLVYGLVKAISVIFSHKYFHYRLHRLILFDLADSINRGVIYGLILGILFFLLIKAFGFIWLKLFSSFFKVKVIIKKNLTPLVKGLFFGILFAYLLVQIFLYVLNSPHDSRFLLGQSFIVFCLFFLFLRFEKINLQLLKAKILIFIKSTGIKITAGVIFSFFVLINLLALSQKLFNPPSGPNVLLIVADALRPDHLGCYGYNRPTSPQIDEFAADALIFEKAVSNASWTLPSMGSVLTSLYPHEHQAFFWTDTLPDECLALPEVFKNKKYKTLAIQTNSCLTEDFNFNQGFQDFHELIFEKGEKLAAKLTAWLRKNKHKPFFAYVHFMDTHLHYDPPEEFKTIFEPEEIESPITGLLDAFVIRTLSETGLSSEDKQHLLNLYDAEIRYFDSSFGKIIENLKKLGIFDNTIIILTADHGEEFWDHNSFEHGHSLYNEVLHVPLIIKYAYHLPVKRINSCVQLLDLFPTLLSMTGIKHNFDLNGKNLIFPVLNNKNINEEIFVEGIAYGAEKKALIKNDWKLILNTGKRSEKSFDPFGDLIQKSSYRYEKSFELYNINQDFSEKNNLINDYPQIADVLKRHLFSFLTISVDISQQKKTKLKEKLEDLKTLGYIR